MTILTDESTVVPGANQKYIEILPGDKWPLPYRGSRYTLKKMEKNVRMCWTRMDIVHPTESIPIGLIKAMIDYKGDSRGSFRVTPHKEVITKRKIKHGVWESVYLGKFNGTYSFDGFDLDPEELNTCNLWRGFHFKHGEEFAVWNREGNNDYLYWTMKGLYFRTIKKYPELCAKVREIRPQCGRVYFTEFGHVWMNLPGSDVSTTWSLKFKKLLQEDKQMLKKNDILLRSIHKRLEATKTFPIYLGKISDFDSGEPPRTHFLSGAKLGMGSEDIDDGDGFDAESWKKMRRDF